MTNKTIPTVKHPFKTERGDTFIVVLFLLLIAGTVIGVVCTQTASMARNANRSYQFEMAQVAANGAVEYAYAVWLKRTANKHNLLSSASDLALNYTPQFSTVNSVTGGTTVLSCSVGIYPLDKYGRLVGSGNLPEPIIGPVWGYPGWWGRAYTYAAIATVKTSDGSVASTVRQFFTYTEVPLFQCMYFFQDNLEIINPAQMTLNGLIHTNKNLYLSVTSPSTTLTINGATTYSGSYASGASVKTSDSNSYTTSLSNQVAPYTPNGPPTYSGSISAMGENFDAVFSDTIYTLSSGSANVSGSYHELIEPASSGTDPLHEKRLSNVAANTDGQTGQTGGLLIYITGTTISASSIEITNLDATTHLPSVTSSNYTVHIGVGSGASISNTTAFINALVTSSSNTTAISKKLAKSGSSSISGTASFYDSREDKYLNIVDINMAALQNVIYSSSYGVTNFSNIIYIYDSADTNNYLVTTSTNRGVVTTATTGTYASENAVRISYGSTITGSDGLTFASGNPVYVQGDYNTGGTGSAVPSNSSSSSGSTYAVSGYTVKPTSIVADAITLLSNRWADANTTSTTSSAPNADYTTYNTALLGGYILSTSIYSGGANNYPRYLENWGGIYCTYYGSMVELFPSNTQRGSWSTSYYTPPNRRFNFDSQFSYKSPPGSVSAIILSRGIWSPASQ